MEKKFIRKLPDIKRELLEGASNFSDINVPTRIRKWTVKKVKRTSSHRSNISDSSKLADDSCDSLSIQEDSTSEEDVSSDGPTRVWVFGSDLTVKPGKGAVAASTEESGGEDASNVGKSTLAANYTGDLNNKIYPGEQDLANLHSNLLLYIASAADNLPVMCQALALGADKNWPNPDDRNRHPLHAAVLTVSTNFFYSGF